MALVAWFFLPDRASKAHFLSDREREIARRRTDRSGKSGREGGLKLSKVGEGLRDPKAYITACVGLLTCEIFLTLTSGFCAA